MSLRRLRRRSRLAAGRSIDGSDTPSIPALRTGSDEAWQDAVEILGPPLRGFSSLRGADDPDETVAQVFLELANGIGDFDGDWESFRTLAFVIARRRVIDEIRYNARRPVEPLASDHLDRDRVGGDVEHEALTNLGRERLLELLGVLTPIQRDVLVMRLVAGLTVPEVAAATGSSETAVKANQRRAIAALRRHLNDVKADDDSTLLVMLRSELGALP